MQIWLPNKKLIKLNADGNFWFIYYKMHIYTYIGSFFFDELLISEVDYITGKTSTYNIN